MTNLPQLHRVVNARIIVLLVNLRLRRRLHARRDASAPAMRDDIGIDARTYF